MCFRGSCKLSDSSIAMVASSSLAVVEGSLYNLAFSLFFIFETGWQYSFFIGCSLCYYNYL